MKVIVIMAGGAGERFWPLSRGNHPKQLLKLTGSGQSLLEEAVERSMAIVPPSNIYIATGKNLQKAIQDADLGIPPENVIAEPCKRNTAGCLIFAAATILAALEAAEKNNALVTIGIQPVRPETGYGYIEISEDNKKQDTETPCYKVASFREKPTPENAAKYIASGNFLWNSGMFFWRLSTFQNEFGKANPVMAQTLEDLTDALMEQDSTRAGQIFNALPNISIDYALMEKAAHVMVIPGKFVWDDVGSWDALDRTIPKDLNGNVEVGDPILIDCQDCIVYNAAGQKNLAVGAVGLKDMIVVVSGDSLLILPKDRAQDVRKVVVALREKNAEQL